MTTLLACGNAALRAGDYEAAIALYTQALAEQPDLGRLLRANLQLARRRLQGREAAAARGLAQYFWTLSADSLFQRKLREIELIHEPPALAAAILTGEQALATLLADHSRASETPLYVTYCPNCHYPTNFSL